MLKSMTAFSREQQSNSSGDIIWEIKSVNHRYLEPGFKLPDDFKILEPDIRQQLGQYLKRGKLDISLRYKLNKKTQTSIQLNADLVKNLRKVEQQVLTIVHEGHSLSVADILRWPGVVDEMDKDFKPLQELALNSLNAALQQLVDNREREGKALYEMIATRCQQVTEIVKQLQQRRPQVVEGMRKKWSAQLDDKLANWTESADSGRLEQELVMLAQKLDVEEELDRLIAHVAEVEQVLDRDEAVGRRLDFLMQELNREANTLSSKSQDTETTRLAVDLKVLIEQMREQVQNIE
ncbi:MAG: YicC family protein [Gammaproteobacteria bacterium]|nr:YicC family protein [Gammaproteobacteria bacterium]